jgi:hypothetical protein
MEIPKEFAIRVGFRRRNVIRVSIWGRGKKHRSPALISHLRKKDDTLTPTVTSATSTNLVIASYRLEDQ